MSVERHYKKLVEKVTFHGERRQIRNGSANSIFAVKFGIDCLSSGHFPLLLGRRIFYKGVFGELAAFLRGPDKVSDFTAQGCNYWGDWADTDGSLRVDYGNKWLNFNGVNQLDSLREKLVNNPTDRRLIISSWDPGSLDSLSLPCCHLLYQWYVRGGKHLDMIWYQRSVDLMVGLPSNIVLASAFNILLANNVGLLPGKISMMLGDVHIYDEHKNSVQKYLTQANKTLHYNDSYPEYTVELKKGTAIEKMTSNSININKYYPQKPIKFELIP
jgi:thymidylate synthase